MLIFGTALLNIFYGWLSFSFNRRLHNFVLSLYKVWFIQLKVQYRQNIFITNVDVRLI